MKTRNITKSLVLVLTIALMSLLIMGCSSSSPKQGTQDSSSQTQETNNPVENTSKDSTLIASFVKNFNDATQYKLESADPIVLDDARANSIANQYFSSTFSVTDNNAIKNIYSYQKMKLIACTQLTI